MTNEQIIFNERLDLMEKGTIGTTGKMRVVEDAEGNRTTYDIDVNEEGKITGLF